MARVIITQALKQEIFSKLKAESKHVFAAMNSLKEQPKKGKALAHIAGIVIKELKYKSFRFYFITDGHILKFGTSNQLEELIIKFVRMSEKNDQQKVIDELKDVLKSLGFSGF